MYPLLPQLHMKKNQCLSSDLRYRNFRFLRPYPTFPPGFRLKVAVFQPHTKLVLRSGLTLTASVMSGTCTPFLLTHRLAKSLCSSEHSDSL